MEATLISKLKKIWCRIQSCVPCLMSMGVLENQEEKQKEKQTKEKNRSITTHRTFWTDEDDLFEANWTLKGSTLGIRGPSKLQSLWWWWWWWFGRQKYQSRIFLLKVKFSSSSNFEEIDIKLEYQLFQILKFWNIGIHQDETNYSQSNLHYWAQNICQML